MKNLDLAVKILLLVGALNWGIIGFFEVNVIDSIFGQTWLDRLIYVLMGASAVYKIANWQHMKGH